MNTVRLRHERGKLRQELSVGRHHLVADEGFELGGEDEGPTPHDYLSAALASCTAITLHMYARRKGWPLQNAEVEVTPVHELEVTRLIRTLHLVGDLTPEQKVRLLEIANRCPIHKTLVGKIEIDTTLK